MNGEEVDLQTATENPHVLWRQVSGLVFWVGLLAVPAFAMKSDVTALAALIGISLSGFTFADAWVSGIFKSPKRKAFLNISPMSWGIGMALLFVVAFPVYVFNRHKLRTVKGGDGYFAAVLVLGIGIILFWFAGIASIVA
jgi:hypothetical protein